MIAGPGLIDHRVVLYQRADSRTPYVVWFEADEDTRGGSMLTSRWCGAYCHTLPEAVEEHAARCKRHGVRSLRPAIPATEWKKVTA